MRALLLVLFTSVAGVSFAKAPTVDLAAATIEDIQAAYKSGTLTAEKLVNLYLQRVAAYDQQGPKINSVILLNPNALVEAKALDAERKKKGLSSPLHGIPIVMKDNI